MSLPVRTKTEDVQTVVDYLRTKVTGATIEEAKAVLGKNVLDGRKINTYEMWGFISKEGNRIKLDTLGGELSRAKPERRNSVYTQVLQSTKPYKSVLEWIFHQGLDEVTKVEVATYWHEHHKSALGTDSEKAIKEMALSFFYLCQAAGLGQLILGRKGRPTRFEIHKEPLGQYIGEGALITEEEEKEEEEKEEEEKEEEEKEEEEKEELETEERVEPTIKPRIFISHSKNMEIVDQIKTMLNYADLDYEIAEEEETSAIPVPEKIFSAMRRCTAAIMCVTADENEKRDDGTYGINQNVLIEIGAAFVLYDKKVILVWDDKLNIPSNLQGLYRCEFSGDELTWSAGMKLMKAVGKFRITKTDT